MTGLQTLTARIALGAAAGIAGVVLSSANAIHRPGKRAFRRVAAWAFVLSRLGTFAVVFLLFRVAPRGDIPAFYMVEAKQALSGLLPYRDYGSSYAPLHSFLDGGVVFLWRSPLALILFAILIESLLFYLWLRVGHHFFRERDLRVAATLYFTSALSIQFVTIDGQDNVLVALLLLLALWMASRRRWFASGAIAGSSVVLVKLIPIFYAPAFFAALKRRWSWAAGFASVVVVGYGSFVALHLPVQQPLAIEGPLKSSGTVPYLIEALTDRSLPVSLWDIVMLLSLGLLYAAVLRRSSGTPDSATVNAALWGYAGATLIVLTFANKSWSPYLLLCLFPLCVAVAGAGLRSRIAFAAFGVVALVEKSYWATLLAMAGARDLRSAVLRREPLYLAFVPVELLLLLGYGWLLKLCLERLRSSREPPVDEVAGPDVALLESVPRRDRSHLS